MEVCRACMNSSKIVTHICAPLKKSEDETGCEPQCVGKILNELAGCELVTTNDELPQFVCVSCVKLAKKALNFKRMVEKSNQHFASQQILMQAVKMEFVDDFEDLRSICDMIDLEDLQPFFSDNENSEDESLRNIKYEKPKKFKHKLRTRNSTKKEAEANCLRTRNKCYPLKSVKIKPKIEAKSEAAASVSQDPYICHFCNFSLSTKGNLKTHLKIHTGERPYKCQRCPKAFIQKNALIVHIRTHTGERPIQCPSCPKTFSQQSHLLQHFRIYPKHQQKSTKNKKFKYRT